MEVLEIIDLLEDAVDGGAGVPLTGKCLLDREELLELISDLRAKLPMI